MKENLQANLFTKYLAGMCSQEEEAFLKNWLKNKKPFILAPECPRMVLNAFWNFMV
jgi:hypothetical protein